MLLIKVIVKGPFNNDFGLHLTLIMIIEMAKVGQLVSKSSWVFRRML